MPACWGGRVCAVDGAVARGSLAPCSIGTGALEHLRARSRCSLQPVVRNRRQRPTAPPDTHNGVRRCSASARREVSVRTVRVAATRSRSYDGMRGAGIAEACGGAHSRRVPWWRPSPETHATGAGIWGTRRWEACRAAAPCCATCARPAATCGGRPGPRVARAPSAVSRGACPRFRASAAVVRALAAARCLGGQRDRDGLTSCLLDMHEGRGVLRPRMVCNRGHEPWRFIPGRWDPPARCAPRGPVPSVLMLYISSCISPLCPIVTLPLPFSCGHP